MTKEILPVIFKIVNSRQSGPKLVVIGQSVRYFMFNKDLSSGLT